LTDQEKARDKRLRKTYGITLDLYNRILEFQDGRCGICGRLATEFKTSLNVDHRHIKIKIRRAPKENHPVIKWLAWTDDIKSENLPAGYGGKTKEAAMELAKLSLMPYTVRGLLCPGRHGTAGHGCCNRLLGRVDNVEWLEKTIAYLVNPPAEQVRAIVNQELLQNIEEAA